MKKFLTLFLALILALSLAACGKEAQDAEVDTEKVEDAADIKTEPEKTPVVDEEPVENKDAANNTETVEQTPEQTTGTPSGESTTPPTSTPATPPASEPTTTPEEFNLSDFKLGVSEDGENVLVTVKAATDAGEATCVMTFWYEGGKLTKETTDYYVPDAETAKLLADELKGDDTIITNTVKTNGNCVSCTMKDSEIEDLRGMTRDELIMVMTYTVGLMK